MFRNTYQKLRFKAAARNPIFLRNGAKFIAQIVTLVACYSQMAACYSLAIAINISTEANWNLVHMNFRKTSEIIYELQWNRKHICVASFIRMHLFVSLWFLFFLFSTYLRMSSERKHQTSNRYFFHSYRTDEMILSII